MHLHILGIGGTFMGGLAQLATALGHRVSGCDAGVYSPMREQLEQAGIAWQEGYDPAQLATPP
ncbi:Mur ligase domain-containing protein, partial [Immundisolibacter sp.]|uniref:Mur ligase domain-containing protein n=1 Tax=Immundisolibacter sp. TaxID=1934948 RepID=UPI002616A048